MQLVSKEAYFDSTIDHKSHTHIMEALKKCVPGIKAIAVRFNKLVAELVEIQKAPGSHYKDRVIPPPMDPNSLFNINLSEELWRDESLDPELDGDVPLWLSDDNFRMGIHHLLKKDHAEEELVHLRHELHALVLWLGEKYHATSQAIDECSGITPSPVLLSLFKLF